MVTLYRCYAKYSRYLFKSLPLVIFFALVYTSSLIYINHSVFNSNKLKSSLDAGVEEPAKSLIPTPRVKYFSTGEHFLQMVEEGLTYEEKETLLDLLDTFTTLMSDLHVPWMLYSGSLLGSWRHHSIIYWDEDIDVIFHVQDKKKVISGLNQLQSRGRYLWTEREDRLKLWSKNKSRIKTRYKWNWPFLDINMYTYNSTHFWPTSPMVNFYYYRNTVDSVFPLTFRPFEGRLVPVPYDTYAFLHTIFGDSVNCLTQSFDHRRESFVKTIYKVPCRKLNGKIPFVHRHYLPNGDLIEKLMLGNHSIATWLGKNIPQIGNGDPFSLE